MSRRVAAGTALVVGLVLAPPAHALTFARCSASSKVQCASLDVPLDQSGKVPGSLRLHVERVRARGPSRGPLSCSKAGRERA